MSLSLPITPVARGRFCGTLGIEHLIAEPARTITDMKILVAILLVGFGVSAFGGILAGPIVNPANGHVYYLLSQNTWSNAEAEAVSLGGHLATIRNAAEDSWVYSTFSAYGGALWIGLTDREKAFQFAWTSGEPVSYTNWGGGQPDNGNGIEFYVHMLATTRQANGTITRTMKPCWPSNFRFTA
jgi:hypothetical protein